MKTVKYDVSFILEREVNGKVDRRMLVPLVSRHSIRRSPATSREWTLGARPVKEKMGYREGRISIAGSSGHKARRGFRAAGSEFVGFGHQLLSEFERFLDDYENLGASSEGPMKRNAGAPRLILRSMLEGGEAFYVEVEDFTVNRDEQYRLIRSYALELVIEGRVSRGTPILFATPIHKARSTKTAADILLAMLQKRASDRDRARELAISDGTDAGHNEILDKAAGLSSTTLAFGQSTNSLSNFVRELPPRWSQFRSPVQEFLNVCQVVVAVSGAINTAASFPRNMVNDIADAADAAVDALQALWDAIPGADSAASRKWFLDAYGGIESVRNAVLTNIGLGNNRLPRSNARVGTSISSDVMVINGTVVAQSTLQEDETLPQFSYRMLGDATRWIEIMELNDMASAYEAADGTPLYAGMSLLVPIDPGVAQTPRDISDLFGTDMKMNGEQFVLAGTTDYALVRGQANFDQAIRRRLTHVSGDSEVFPRWGMPPLIGEPGVAGTVGYIAAHVREQLEADHRVKRVDSVAVTGDGDSYNAAFDLVAASGATTSIIAPVPA